MKKQLISIFVVFLSILLFSFNIYCIADESVSSPYFKAIRAFEEYVIEQMELDKVPGLSVGFLKDNFTWAKGLGYSDLENMVPAISESSYRLASITKTITAIAVLQLAEAGKINLDAEVQAYVPYFPRKKWPVTIRLLLGHLGGIPHYIDYDKEGHIKVHKNTKEALAIFQDFELVAEPGIKYNYSSYGFNLLGAVIEGASGRSYGDYIKENIFEPLGMKNSRIDDPVDLIPNRVKGYRLIDGEIKNSEYVDISSRFAGGGTRSTVVDLLKYARGIIEGNILKKETWQQMFTSMATSNGRLTGYGMGWVVQPCKGHFKISHGGSQPETKTYLLIFPTESFAIALASNRENLDLIPYVNRLAELVLNEDLDSITYVASKEEQAIYDACDMIFSYGISQFDWKSTSAVESEKDLAQAFSYFNTHVNKNALKNNFKDIKEKIDDGIHPISKNAFIKVGTFMASALTEAYGKTKLQRYFKKGPLAFFSDYIQLNKKWPQNKKRYTFSKSFSQMISGWEKDWNGVYTDYVRQLYISIHTDFDELGPKLKQSFSKSNIYPDFNHDMTRVAQSFLVKNKPEKALKVLNLSAGLYPGSPAPLSGLAGVHIWMGNVEKARSLYKKAFAMDPEHPSLSLNEFEYFGNMLLNAKKIKEVFSLVETALELYPKDAILYKNAGDLYLQFEKKDKAIHCYKRALELNPKLKVIKERLEKLKKGKQEKTIHAQTLGQC